MVRLLRYRFIFILVLFFLRTPLTHSKMDFSIVGVGTQSKPEVSGVPSSLVLNGVSFSNLSLSTKEKLGIGGGALLNAYLVDAISLELGALYVARKFETTTSFTLLGTNLSGTETHTLHYLETPLTLRVWFSPYFSLGAGGYYANGFGNDFTQANIKKKDYGALGSIQFRLPLSSSSRFLVDGRYQHGLTNVDNTSYGTQEYRTLQVLVGLNFGGGK